MSQYFFHSQDGHLVLDREGTECADDGAAKVAAVRLMGEMIADQPEDFWGTASMKVMVTNTAGVLLFALDLSAVEAPIVAAPSLPPVALAVK